jgi:amylosucrase
MLWLGDEVGQLDDPSYLDDPDRRDDERWLHRAQRPRDRYATRADATTSAGRLFAAITKLIAVRHTTPAFDGTHLVGFDVPGDTVAAFQRPADDHVVLVLANVAATAASVDGTTLSGFAPGAHDLIEAVDVDLTGGIELPPCGFRWLRVTPR